MLFSTKNKRFNTKQTRVSCHRSSTGIILFLSNFNPPSFLNGPWSPRGSSLAFLSHWVQRSCSSQTLIGCCTLTISGSATQKVKWMLREYIIYSKGVRSELPSAGKWCIWAYARCTSLQALRAENRACRHCCHPTCSWHATSSRCCTKYPETFLYAGGHTDVTYTTGFIQTDFLCVPNVQRCTIRSTFRKEKKNTNVASKTRGTTAMSTTTPDNNVLRYLVGSLLVLPSPCLPCLGNKCVDQLGVWNDQLPRPTRLRSTCKQQTKQRYCSVKTSMYTTSGCWWDVPINWIISYHSIETTRPVLHWRLQLLHAALVFPHIVVPSSCWGSDYVAKDNNCSPFAKKQSRLSWQHDTTG